MTLLWVVVAVLVVVAALRTFGSGSFAPGAWVAAATPLAFLVVGPIVVLAAVWQDWSLVAASSVLAGCEILWLWVQWGGRRRHPGGSGPGGPEVTVFAANVLFDNGDVASVARAIAASAADVVILLELTSAHLASLDAIGVLDSHRWRLVLPAPTGSLGIGLWSRLPVRDLEPWNLEGIPQIRGRVHVDGDRSVGLFAVHAPAPWPGPARRWVDALSTLGVAVGSTPGPVVVAGDLNATWDHRPFRLLLGTGLRDAAVESGRALARTWPSGRLVPRLLRIDHVLVAGDVTVAGYEVGPAMGSDHRAVTATLALPPGPGDR